VEVAQDDASCVPQCKWRCTEPRCSEVCEPVCHAPRCETRCAASKDLSSCTEDCETPQCTLLCPPTPCAARDCASCRTSCAEPMCFLKCPGMQPCRNVCETPKCDWHCREPDECAKPTCQLECEPPKGCEHTTYHTQLPPRLANETSVAAFRAPRLAPRKSVPSNIMKRVTEDSAYYAVKQLLSTDTAPVSPPKTLAMLAPKAATVSASGGAAEDGFLRDDEEPLLPGELGGDEGAGA